jgi:hypothetical protein
LTAPTSPLYLTTWLSIETRAANGFAGFPAPLVRSPHADPIQDPDPAKSARAMQALLKMKKLDIAALQQAFKANPS